MRNKIIVYTLKLFILSIAVSIILTFGILFLEGSSNTSVSSTPLSSSYEPMHQNDAYRIALPVYVAFDTFCSFAANETKAVPQNQFSDSVSSTGVNQTSSTSLDLKNTNSESVKQKGSIKDLPSTDIGDMAALQNAENKEITNTVVQKAEFLMKGVKPYEIFTINDIQPIGLVGVDEKKEILFEVKQMGYTFSAPFGQQFADGSVLSGLKLKDNSVIAVVFKKDDKIIELQWIEDEAK